MCELAEGDCFVVITTALDQGAKVVRGCPVRVRQTKTQENRVIGVEDHRAPSRAARAHLAWL